jgi:hypothetical protein
MYQQAGWRLRRVLTDNGKEFKGPSPPAASALGVRVTVTRTKPRHAWTNGFVERRQKTILHEHWRIAFRRQYFTGRRNARWIAFCSSTTMSGRIEAIGSAGAPRPPCSMEPLRHELAD